MPRRTLPRMIAAILLGFSLLTTLAGCSQQAVLEQAVAAAQSGIPQLKEQLAGTYSDITITASGSDTMVYTFTYQEAVDVAVATEALDGQAASLQQAVDEQVFPAMTKVGIAAPKVVYTYLNPDGTQVWSRTFEPTP